MDVACTEPGGGGGAQSQCYAYPVPCWRRPGTAAAAAQPPRNEEEEGGLTKSLGALQWSTPIHTATAMLSSWINQRGVAWDLPQRWLYFTIDHFP